MKIALAVVITALGVWVLWPGTAANTAANGTAPSGGNATPSNPETTVGYGTSITGTPGNVQSHTYIANPVTGDPLS